MSRQSAKSEARAVIRGEWRERLIDGRGPARRSRMLLTDSFRLYGLVLIIRRRRHSRCEPKRRSRWARRRERLYNSRRNALRP